MKKALIVGGNSGIGLALVLKLLQKGYEHVYIVGKAEINVADVSPLELEKLKAKTSFYRVNLINGDYKVFDEISDINALFITVGFGRVAKFEDLTKKEVENLIKCNMLANIAVIKHYYDKIASHKDFYCAVMGSIAGHVASPLFSVYGATKFGLCSFIENVNAELSCSGYKNRILDVSPGSLKGTNFNGQGNDITQVSEVADSILEKAFNRETLYIPQYNEVYKGVIDRYHANPQEFAKLSYEYKINSGRYSNKPQVTVGYLSGTFDLFHYDFKKISRPMDTHSL